jgi:hypothetical protein
MAGKLNVKERIVETASRLFYHQGLTAPESIKLFRKLILLLVHFINISSQKKIFCCIILNNKKQNFFNNLENFLINEQNQGKLLKLIDYRIQLQQQSNCSGCHFIKINAEIGRKNKDVENIVNEHKQQQRNFINTIILSIEHNSVLNDQQLTNMIFPDD